MGNRTRRGGLRTAPSRDRRIASRIPTATRHRQIHGHPSCPRWAVRFQGATRLR